ncbi:hypothetical protein CSC88_24750, partial [Klebsiella pneumoniae]
MVALTDAKLNHHPVIPRPQRQSGNRPDFQSAAPDRSTDAKRPRLRRSAHDGQATDLTHILARPSMYLKFAMRLAPDGLPRAVLLDNGAGRFPARGGDLGG